MASKGETVKQRGILSLLLIDVGLFALCAQWTPESVGEAFFLRALRAGLPYSSPIGTAPSASRAYQEGKHLYFEKQLTRGVRSAALCAQWMEEK